MKHAKSPKLKRTWSSRVQDPQPLDGHRGKVTTVCGDFGEMDNPNTKQRFRLHEKVVWMHDVRRGSTKPLIELEAAAARGVVQAAIGRNSSLLTRHDGAYSKANQQRA